jgi:excisionase family DNA binding protein
MKATKQQRARASKRTAAERAATAAKRAAKRAAADTITVEDVAARLGIGRNQAYEYVRTGKIPSMKFSSDKRCHYLIARITIDRILRGELTVPA